MMSQELYNKVTEKDVKLALDYIAEHGNSYDEYDILHIDVSEKKRARNRYVKYGGKKIATREVPRVALFVNLGGKLSVGLDIVEEIQKIGKQRGFRFTSNDMPSAGARPFLMGKVGLQKDDFIMIDKAGRRRVIGGDYVDGDDAGYEYEKREIEKVSRTHVKQAFAYILSCKKIRKDGMLHYERLNPKSVKYVCDEEGNKFAMSQAAKLAYLYALKDAGKIKGDAPFHGATKNKKIKKVWVFLHGGNAIRLWRLLKVRIYDIEGEDASNLPLVDALGNAVGGIGEASRRAMRLLKKFKQIIFFGPPGTGKTRRAKKLLPFLLNISDEDAEVEKKQQEGRWDIVQFHPSYNYEDFVRGVKVETTANGAVAYKTENRVFGDMCKRAAEDKSKNKYVLIIDEINRANVSAVLGELIYALEYRGKKVRTPYRVSGSGNLVIPENLYVIGTMNTADRTIGQIDYAVRRRFAFLHCPPDEDKVTNADAKDLFRSVDKIFEHTSPDYKADDVRIGHSYFLEGGAALADKIIYQVIPILREYVKDGVLLKTAEEEIVKIEERMEALSDDDAEYEGDNTQKEGAQDSMPSKTKQNWFWKIGGEEEEGPMAGIGQVVLAIVRHYVKTNNITTAKGFFDWFPDKRKTKTLGVRRLSDIDAEGEYLRRRFFFKEGQFITLDGEKYCVSNQWGSLGVWKPDFDQFREGVKGSGYKIRSEGESYDE